MHANQVVEGEGVRVRMRACVLWGHVGVGVGASGPSLLLLPPAAATEAAAHATTIVHMNFSVVVD